MPKNFSQTLRSKFQKSPTPISRTTLSSKLSQKEFGSSELKKQSVEGLPPNPMYIMTRSSCDGRKSHKIRIPLTRNPVKDFGSRYLGPKMWPTSQTRLSSQRGSLMPRMKNPLFAVTKSHINLNLANSLEKDGQNMDNQTPLIFSDKKQQYSSIGNRKFSLANNDIKRGTNVPSKVDEGLSNMFMKRSNSTAVYKSNSVRNLVLKNELKNSTSYIESKNFRNNSVK